MRKRDFSSLAFPRVMPFLCLLSLAATLPAFSQSQGAGLPPFGWLTPTYYATGADPRDVVVADVNGDGKADLIVADGGDDTVSVLLGNGDGTFKSALTFAAGHFPNQLVAADLNRDGKMDLAVTNLCASPTDCGTSSISILLGNGDGSFQNHMDYANPAAAPRGMVVADFNSDGKLDLALSNEDFGGGPSSVSVLLGNGDGSLQSAVQYEVSDFPLDMVAGDFNNDGKLDLAVAQSTLFPLNGLIAVLLGNGDGTFQPAVNYAAGPEPLSLVAADFDGDGNLDLADADTLGQVTIIKGIGDGTFQKLRFYSVPAADALVSGDFNGDGKLDLVAGTSGSAGTVAILLGNGDLTFQTPMSFTTGTEGGFPATIADLNGDGRPDLATTDGFGDRVAVLLQTDLAVSPTGLTFAKQKLGTASAAQTVTLTNIGTNLITLSPPTFGGSNSGDFGLTNNCSGSLAAGASCTLNVTFTPTAPFSRAATLSLNDSVVGSPQVLNLTGTGLGGVVQLSTTSIDFGQAVVASKSVTLSSTLTNKGNDSLNVSSITVSGDFLESSACKTLLVNQSCKVFAAFKPTAAGLRTGSITITDDAGDSPQTISLSGTGIFFSVTPSFLDFGGVKLGTTSQPQTVTVTNKAHGSQKIYFIGLGGDNPNQYAQTNTCPAQLDAGASCTISVTFSPTGTFGTKTATLLIGGGGSTEVVTLTGTGT